MYRTKWVKLIKYAIEIEGDYILLLLWWHSDSNILRYEFKMVIFAINFHLISYKYLLYYCKEFSYYLRYSYFNKLRYLRTKICCVLLLWWSENAIKLWFFWINVLSSCDKTMQVIMYRKILQMVYLLFILKSCLHALKNDVKYYESTTYRYSYNSFYRIIIIIRFLVLFLTLL